MPSQSEWVTALDRAQEGDNEALIEAFNQQFGQACPLEQVTVDALFLGRGWLYEVRRLPSGYLVQSSYELSEDGVMMRHEHISNYLWLAMLGAYLARTGAWMPDNQWMTPAEVAVGKGVNRNNVFVALRAGKFPNAIQSDPQNPRRSEWLIPIRDYEAWEPRNYPRK